MGKPLIAWPNRIDSAVLSLGSWAAALPLSNAQTKDLAEYARSSDALAASTKFLVSLASARTVGLFAVCNHNLSSAATYRLRGYSDAGLTANLYDSGAGIAAFPTGTFNATFDEWNEGTLFDLGSDEALMGGLRAALVHVLATPVAAQYWLLEITDTANPDNYVQFGRVFIGETFTPDTAMIMGAGIFYKPRSDSVRAKSGAKYSYQLPAPRGCKFTLPLLSLNEAMYSVFDIQRRELDTGELFFVYDQADVAHLLRRSFLCTLANLGPIEQATVQNYGCGFEVEEIL